MDAAIHFPALINTLGHLAGAAAFLVFIYVLSQSARRDPRADIRVPAAAAFLALLWNAGSLAVLASASFGGIYTEALAAFSFAVLSLLPGVLLHLSLGNRRPWLLAVGYLLGGAAFLTHVFEIFQTAGASHLLGLRLVTFGFGALAIVAAITLAREHDPVRGAGVRMLAAMALFLFAASFIHFGSEHGRDAWAHELLFHHAGIPLALFILLQDYRFLLLDVFVRLLGSALLAAGFAAGILAVADLLGLWRLDASGGVALAALIGAISAGVLLFPVVHERLRGWMRAKIFRRGSIGETLEKIRELPSGSEDALLDRAAALFAEYAKARRRDVFAAAAARRTAADGRLRSHLIDEHERATLGDAAAWAEVAAPIRVAGEDVRLVLLGVREAGRRYLSEDFDDLDLLSAEVTDRIAGARREEMQRLVAKAELNALRAQINPHFLFNSLNALYGVIPRSAAEARGTLLNLAEVFRYLLQGDRQFVSLGEELSIVEAYLQIERLRLGSRLETAIEVSDEARPVAVPVLSIQPLVENAVKHGVSNKPEGGHVRVEARIVENLLRIEVSDDGPGFDPASPPPEGYGLQNVRRRLQLFYGETAELSIRSSPQGTAVSFRIPVDGNLAAPLEAGSRTDLGSTVAQ